MEAAGNQRRASMPFEDALKHLFGLEKKLRVEMLENLRELKLQMTQNSIDLVSSKASKLFQIRQQLYSSKVLYRQERDIMEEFEKLKGILETVPNDDNNWNRAKTDCFVLGEKLNDVRKLQSPLSGKVRELEFAMEKLLSRPLDDLEPYDIEALKQEEIQYERVVPSLSSYPLFNSAPYGSSLPPKGEAPTTFQPIILEKAEVQEVQPEDRPSSQVLSEVEQPDSVVTHPFVLDNQISLDASEEPLPQIIEPLEAYAANEPTRTEIDQMLKDFEEQGDIKKELFGSWLTGKEAELKTETGIRDHDEDSSPSYEIPEPVLAAEESVPTAKRVKKAKKKKIPKEPQEEPSPSQEASEILDQDHEDGKRLPSFYKEQNDECWSEAEKQIKQREEEEDEKRLGEQRWQEKEAQLMERQRIEEENLAILKKNEELAQEEKALLLAERIQEEQQLLDEAKVEEDKRKEAENGRALLEQQQLEEVRAREEEQILRDGEEQRRVEEAKLEEEQRVAEELKVQEEQRMAEEIRFLEEQRVVEEARIQEEQRADEELKLQEEQRVAEEAKLQEDQRVVEELKVQEEQKMVEEAKFQEEQRMAEEEAKLQEEQRVTEELKVQEEQRVAEEAKFQEEQRVAEEAKLQEEQRIAEELKVLEEQKMAEEAKFQEEQRMAEEIKLQEEQRVAEELKVQEEQRVAEEAKFQEEQRVAEEAKLQEEQRVTEELKVQEEQQMAEEAKFQEEQRIAEEIKFQAEQRVAQELKVQEEQQMAEEARIYDEERVAEETIIQQEQLVAEEARIQEDERVAEVARIHEAQGITEEIKIQEEQRVAEEARIQEEQRVDEETRIQDEQRVAEEGGIQEQQRVAEEVGIQKEQRVAEEARIQQDQLDGEEVRWVQEEQRAAEDALIQEEERATEETRIHEQQHVAQEFKFQEEQRFAEESRIQDELDITEDARIQNEQEVSEEHIIREKQPIPGETKILNDNLVTGKANLPEGQCNTEEFMLQGQQSVAQGTRTLEEQQLAKRANLQEEHRLVEAIQFQEEQQLTKEAEIQEGSTQANVIEKQFSAEEVQSGHRWADLVQSPESEYASEEIKVLEDEHNLARELKPQEEHCNTGEESFQEDHRCREEAKALKAQNLSKATEGEEQKKEDMQTEGQPKAEDDSIQAMHSVRPNEIPASKGDGELTDSYQMVDEASFKKDNVLHGEQISTEVEFQQVSKEEESKKSQLGQKQVDNRQTSAQKIQIESQVQNQDQHIQDQEPAHVGHAQMQPRDEVLKVEDLEYNSLTKGGSMPNKGEAGTKADGIGKRSTEPGTTQSADDSDVQPGMSTQKTKSDHGKGETFESEEQIPTDLTDPNSIKKPLRKKGSKPVQPSENSQDPTEDAKIPSKTPRRPKGTQDQIHGEDPFRLEHVTDDLELCEDERELTGRASQNDHSIGEDEISLEAPSLPEKTKKKRRIPQPPKPESIHPDLVESEQESEQSGRRNQTLGIGDATSSPLSGSRSELREFEAASEDEARLLQDLEEQNLERIEVEFIAQKLALEQEAEMEQIHDTHIGNLGAKRLDGDHSEIINTNPQKRPKMKVNQFENTLTHKPAEKDHFDHDNEASQDQDEIQVKPTVRGSRHIDQKTMSQGQSGKGVEQAGEDSFTIEKSLEDEERSSKVPSKKIRGQHTQEEISFTHGLEAQEQIWSNNGGIEDLIDVTREDFGPATIDTKIIPQEMSYKDEPLEPVGANLTPGQDRAQILEHDASMKNVSLTAKEHDTELPLGHAHTKPLKTKKKKPLPPSPASGKAIQDVLAMSDENKAPIVDDDPEADSYPMSHDISERIHQKINALVPQIYDIDVEADDEQSYEEIYSIVKKPTHHKKTSAIKEAQIARASRKKPPKVPDEDVYPVNSENVSLNQSKQLFNDYDDSDLESRTFLSQGLLETEFPVLTEPAHEEEHIYSKPLKKGIRSSLEAEYDIPRRPQSIEASPEPHYDVPPKGNKKRVTIQELEKLTGQSVDKADGLVERSCKTAKVKGEKDKAGAKHKAKESTQPGNLKSITDLDIPGSDSRLVEPKKPSKKPIGTQPSKSEKVKCLFCSCWGCASAS